MHEDMMEEEKEDFEDTECRIAQPIRQSLSPIVEMNEGSIIEFSLVEDQLEKGYHDLQDDSIVSQETDSCQPNSGCKRPFSLNIPETPPGILRGQIEDLNKQFEYMKKEHDELRAFTTLEKQVEHHHCVSKSEVHRLNNELDMVNEKMQCLIRENETFRDEIELKKLEVEKLKRSHMESIKTQKMFEKFVSQLEHKLKKNLEHEAQEIIESSPSLKFLMDNSEDSNDEDKNMDIFEKVNPSNYLSALKGIKLLVKRVMINKCDLIDEVKHLKFENEKIQQKLRNLCKKSELSGKALDNAKSEITHLNTKLSSAEVQVKELKDLLVSESELKETVCFLQMVNTDVLNRIDSLEIYLANTCDENKILKENLIAAEIENNDLKIALTTSKHKYEQVLQKISNHDKDVQELNSFQKLLQNSCSSLINELENIIESLDLKDGLKAIFDNLEINQNIFNNLDFFLGSEIKQAIYDLIRKLKIKLISYEKHMNLGIHEINARIELSENEIHQQAIEIKFLEKNVKDELTSRLSKLESTFHSCNEKAIDFKDTDEEVATIQGMSKRHSNEGEIRSECIESKNIVAIIPVQKELEYIFNTINQCLNSDNLFASFKESVDSILENQKFPSLNKLLDTNVTDMFLNYYDKLNKSKYLIKKESKKCQKIRENECSRESKEQLTVLKELLIIEILSLDGNECKNDLLTYSSKDIFEKFMQSIIKKESEVTTKLREDYESNLNITQDQLEEANKTKKKQLSWIRHLENELNQMNNHMEDTTKSKCEMEFTTKSLSKNLGKTLNEMSELKTKNVQLTSENSIFCEKLKKINQLVKTEKATVNYLRINIKDLKKEFQFKVKEMLGITSNLSSLILSKQNQCNGMNIKLPKTSEGFYEDHKFQCPPINHCISYANCSDEGGSTIPNEVTEVEVFIQNLDEEKLLLKELLLSTNLVNLNFDKFDILKDVVEYVFNKIYELEKVQAERQLKFENNVDSVINGLQDLKLSLSELYKEFVPNIENKENETVMLFSYSENVMSLKKELEHAQVECLHLNKMSDHFQNFIKSGQGFINGLKDQLKLMVYETSKKDILIEGLYSEIAVEQHKNKEMENKYAALNKELISYSQKNSNLEEEIKCLNLQLANINVAFSSTNFNFPDYIKDVKEKSKYLQSICKENICMKSSIVEINENLIFFSDQCNLMSIYISSIEETIHLLLEKRSQLEEQIKYFTLQISDINSVLTSVKYDIPVEAKELKEQINYVCRSFKENTVTKSSITVANQSICFFSNQCTLMINYIKKLETSANTLLHHKEQSDYEFNLVKNQLTNTKIHIDEANKVFNHLISLLPSNPSTPVQAVNLVEQIVAKYNELKVSEVNLVQLQKVMEEKLSKQVEEIKCLNKSNTNLKLDQGRSEDSIRNLRSELRTLRFQYQKRLIECNTNHSYVKNAEATEEFGIQTDVLCCSQREHEILILKETLRDNTNKIQFLERRIKTKSSPYKRKPDLDVALFQAKERIKELKFELMKKENYNKDLIELCQSQEK